MNIMLNAGSFSSGTGFRSCILILFSHENDVTFEQFVIITLKTSSNITSILGKEN
jgi:hypothetical protein